MANAKATSPAYDQLLEACKMNLQDAKDALSGDWQPTEAAWRSVVDHLTQVIAEAEGSTTSASPQNEALERMIINIEEMLVDPSLQITSDCGDLLLQIAQIGINALAGKR